MTSVDQTIFEDGKGDCLRACIATVTGIPTGKIPNFAEDGSYWDGARRFLGLKARRIFSIDWSGEGYDHGQYISYPETPCILSGWSPRFNADGKRKQHAVVGRAVGWSFKIEHDPHPSRAGIVGEPFAAAWIFPAFKTVEQYEMLIEPLREVARGHGYALAVHGTLVRDIDLIAAPWSEPLSAAKVLAEAIRAKAEQVSGAAFMAPHESDEYFQNGCPGLKAHGRLCWSFHLGGGPYIDLSVLAPGKEWTPA